MNHHLPPSVALFLNASRSMSSCCGGKAGTLGVSAAVMFAWVIAIVTQRITSTGVVGQLKTVQLASKLARAAKRRVMGTKLIDRSRGAGRNSDRAVVGKRRMASFEAILDFLAIIAPVRDSDGHITDCGSTYSKFCVSRTCSRRL